MTQHIFMKMFVTYPFLWKTTFVMSE